VRPSVPTLQLENALQQHRSLRVFPSPEQRIEEILGRDHQTLGFMNRCGRLLEKFADERTLGRLAILDAATGKPIVGAAGTAANEQQLAVRREGEGVDARYPDVLVTDPSESDRPSVVLPAMREIVQAYTTRRVAPPSKGTMRPVRYPGIAGKPCLVGFGARLLAPCWPRTGLEQ